MEGLLILLFSGWERYKTELLHSWWAHTFTEELIENKKIPVNKRKAKVFSVKDKRVRGKKKLLWQTFYVIVLHICLPQTLLYVPWKHFSRLYKVYWENSVYYDLFFVFIHENFCFPRKRHSVMYPPTHWLFLYCSVLVQRKML